MRFACLVIIGAAVCTASLYFPSFQSSAANSMSVDSSNLYACPRCRKAKPKGPKKKPVIQNNQNSAIC